MGQRTIKNVVNNHPFSGQPSTRNYLKMNMTIYAFPVAKNMLEETSAGIS